MFALLETKPTLKLVLTLDVPKNFEHLVYFVRVRASVGNSSAICNGFDVEQHVLQAGRCAHSSGGTKTGYWGSCVAAGVRLGAQKQPSACLRCPTLPCRTPTSL